MGVHVGGVLCQRSDYFRWDGMAWEMFGWQPVSNVMDGRGTVSAGHGALQLHAYPTNDARQLYTYPRLREASRLATVVSLAHIGVVVTGDLAGGL